MRERDVRRGSVGADWFGIRAGNAVPSRQQCGPRALVWVQGGVRSFSSKGRWSNAWAKTLVGPLVLGLSSPALTPLAPLLGLPGAAVAHAQKSGDIGEKMFYEGLTKMKAGKYDEACPLLDEAFRSDSRPASLFYFAECEMGAGRTSSALGLYRDYVALAGGLKGLIRSREKNREEEAKAAVKRLEEEVPQLALTLPSGAPKGIVVSRDGVQVQEEVFGQLVPLDPGVHTVIVELPNGDKKETKIKLEKNDRKKVEVTLPKAADDDDEEEDGGAAGKKKKKKKKKKGDADDDEEEAKPVAKIDQDSKLVPYVALGIGGAGILAGGVTGLLALGKKGDIDKECVGTKCSTKGLDAANGAKSMATISNIGFAVGVVGIGVGVTMLLLGPSKPKKKDPALDEAFIQPFVSPGRDSTLFGAQGRF
jgi:tetratricopeptide (TPR) repeat protein